MGMYYTPQISAQTLASAKVLSQTIRCAKSGFPLGQLQITIIEGQLSYLEAHNDAIYLHPFYRLSSTVLLKKLEDSLHQAQSNGWAVSQHEQDRLRLLTSATMYCIGVLKQEGYSLPSFAVAAGSAGRLLALAKWFFFLSSQRLELPQYSVGPRTENVLWENFKHWLDAAFQVRDDWGKKARVLEQEAQKRLYDENVRDIKSESFRRVDLNKVWKWIENQLEEVVPAGRRTTLRKLFLDGDHEAHEWLADDVDDLQELLVKHCDCGNEIMHFIQKRLNGIRALIRDFYSGFTLLGSGLSGGPGQNEVDRQTKEEIELIAEYDAKVEVLESLPQKPLRESFASLALFLKAEAQWNILKRRWDQKQKEQKEEEVKNPIHLIQLPPDGGFLS